MFVLLLRILAALLLLALLAALFLYVVARLGSRLQLEPRRRRLMALAIGGVMVTVVLIVALCTSDPYRTYLIICAVMLAGVLPAVYRLHHYI